MRFRGQRMRSKSGLALAGAVALAMPAISKGQQIVQYNFANGGATGVTLATMETPTTVATNTTAGNMSLGSHTVAALNEGAAAAGFWTSPGPDYISVSRDATTGTDDTNYYVDFTVTANTGFVMNPTGVTLVGGQGGGTAGSRSYYVFDSNDGLPTGANALTSTGAAPPPFATVNSGTLIGEGAFSVVRNTSAAMNSPTIAFPANDQNLYTFEVRVYFDTQTVSQNIDLASIALNGSVVAAPLQETWVSSGSGDYNQRTSWNAGTAPNAVGAEADFLGAITSNQVVFTTVPITLGKMVFNNSAASYALTGAVGANLMLQTSTGSAMVDVQAGTHEINLPIKLVSNTTFQTDAASASLVIADPMTINPGIALTTTGSGTVNYESTITLLSGATMSIANSTYAHALTINGSAAATVAQTSSKTLLQLDSLTLAGTSGAWTGKLDLTSNDMIVKNGDLTMVTNEIKSGENQTGTPWTGTSGITSSAAVDSLHRFALGVIQNVDLQGHPVYGATTAFGTFDGQSPGVNDVLVKYTYFGDADLNGKIDAADYSHIDNGANSAGTLSGWVNGDFNYDGTINGADYTLIDNASNNQTSGVLIAAATSEIAAVPEPVAVGAVFLLFPLSRRNRRRIKLH